MKLKFFVLLFCMAQVKAALCQDSAFKTDNPLKSHLDSIVQQAAVSYLQGHVSFDLSIGIYQNGRPFQYYYHKGKGALPNGDAYYGLGSVAKTFAGWMLANAVVEGRLKLSDDIRKYLPGSYPNLEYGGHPVRLVDLANHTSGMPQMSKDYPEKMIDSIGKLPPEKLAAFFKAYTADSLFADMHQFRLDTIPGTKFRYNGNAVMVLIAILQRVYHRSYPELVRSYLRKANGMYHTTPTLDVAAKRGLLMGHDERGKAAPLTVDEGFRAAPSMLSTPNDMLRYVRANLNEGSPAIHLSHKATFASPGGMKLGLNWIMGREENGLPFIMHTGRDGVGFTSLCYIYPGKKTGIVVLVNDGAGEGQVAALKDSIISRLF